MSRILLSISHVASNLAGAHRTIQEFGSYFRAHPHSRYGVELGVETSAELQASLVQFAGIFPKVYVWDDAATLRALDALRGLPQPFFSGFSYGGTLNRVLILSRLAGCDYLLRVDPGTLPPGGLWGMIERQVDALKTHRVVSGVYADRLAIRDKQYARSSMRDRYLAFVARQTGVALHQQITGGALFMMASPGIPAMPFQPWLAAEPTLVWGSDDAIFQEAGIRSQVFTEHKVTRHDPFGKAKPPIEYFRGVAGAVYLNHLRRSAAARTLMGTFIRDLNEFLDPSLAENRGSRLPLKEDDVAPARFLDSIDRGYANYLLLLGVWNDVVDAVQRAIAADTLALQNG
jgi:hypothetical protein